RNANMSKNKLTLLKGGKPQKHQEEEEDCCPVCNIAKQVVSDFIKIINDKELDLEEAIDAVFRVGYDVGYRIALIDDVNAKSEILDEMNKE
ncbi:MAG: hypothetical protein WDA59_06945, partial [Methanofastidiosum sp.]